MRLELFEQSSILHTKREFLFSEAKVFMKLLNATSCHCIKIQRLVISKTQKKVWSLKQDCQLHSNLYVASQNREGDLEKFFANANHTYPPSLPIYGKMRSTDKLDTIKIFENLVETSSVKPDFTAEVLDGATVVQAVVPKGSTNFGQYCRNKFTTYLFNKISPEYPKPCWYCFQ